MFGGRIIFALLFLSVFVAPSWSQAGRVKVAATEPDRHGLQTHAPTWSDISRPLTPTGRPAEISHLAPWKSRRKAVLEQTNPQIGEECDLGPVLLPSGPIHVVMVEALARPLSSGHPLRC
jgi:hypothetical protein